jgi:tetratricopeptide (TPR) repeat protein
LKKEEQPVAKDEKFYRFFEEGNRLFKEGKYSEAIASYKSCLDENPQAYKIHYYIGNCYMEMNEIELGQEEYEKVLQGAKQEESPESAEAQAEASYLLGELSAKRKDKEAALKYFMRCLELDPQNEIYAYNVGDVCFSLRKIEEAIHHFTLASEIKPSWPNPYLKLGYVYLHKADYPNARKNFIKFLELDPEHPQAESIKKILDTLKRR